MIRERVKSSIYPIICLLYGLGLIAVGIVVLAQRELVLSPMAYIGGTIMAGHGLFQLITVFVNRKKIGKTAKGSLGSTGVIYLLGGLAIIILPWLTITLLMMIFTCYTLLNALLKIIDFSIACKDDRPGKISDLLVALFFLTFTVLMIFVPEMGQKAFLIVAGIYLILFGTSEIYDFIAQCIPVRKKRKMWRRIRIAAPLLFSSLMPLTALKKTEKQRVLYPELHDNALKTVYADGKEDSGAPDIEIFIHVSDGGVGIIGHCDIFFDGEILSYGSYDAKSESLFGGVGDGVFFTADKKRYIRFSVTHDKKTIFGYGLKLTEEQKESIRSEIKELKESVYPWQTPFEAKWSVDKSTSLSEFTDYGSSLWNGTGAHFYKFNEGMFKTYFVLTSNCVLMAEKIILATDPDIVNLNGVLSPGSYYDYLESKFPMRESNVICKTVYTKDNTAGWTGCEPVVTKWWEGDNWHRRGERKKKKKESK